MDTPCFNGLFLYDDTGAESGFQVEIASPKKWVICVCAHVYFLWNIITPIHSYISPNSFQSLIFTCNWINKSKLLWFQVVTVHYKQSVDFVHIDCGLVAGKLIIVITIVCIVASMCDCFARVHLCPVENWYIILHHRVKLSDSLNHNKSCNENWREGTEQRKYKSIEYSFELSYFLTFGICPYRFSLRKQFRSWLSIELCHSALKATSLSFQVFRYASEYWSFFS